MTIKNNQTFDKKNIISFLIIKTKIKNKNLTLTKI